MHIELLPLFARCGFVASPTVQSSTNWTRPAMYDDTHKIYMAPVHNLMLGPGGDESKVSSAQVMFSQLRLKALIHCQTTRPRDSVHDCICRRVHFMLVMETWPMPTCQDGEPTAAQILAASLKPGREEKRGGSEVLDTNLVRCCGGLEFRTVVEP